MGSTLFLYATIFSSIFQSMFDEVGEINGAELQAEIVEHNGQNIGYQYQFWKINEKSVCASQRNNLQNYSNCTIAAKSLFTETCTYIQNNPRSNWQYKRLKAMYCNAAVNYQPTIANVSAVNIDQTEINEARQRCNILTVDALGNNDAELNKERDEACQYYKSLLNKSD